MPKAKSLTGKTEIVRRWKIYPDGRVEDPHGHIHPTLPVEIAYSPQCINLAKAGHVEVEGVEQPKVLESPVPEVVSESVPANDESAEVFGYSKKRKK